MMSYIDENHNDGYEYNEVPKLLVLDDDEKFKDTDGNIAEIETRGDRNHRNVYFLASDVMKVFEFKNITDILTKNLVIMN